MHHRFTMSQLPVEDTEKLVISLGIYSKGESRGVGGLIAPVRVSSGKVSMADPTCSARRPSTSFLGGRLLRRMITNIGEICTYHPLHAA